MGGGRGGSTKNSAPGGGSIPAASKKMVLSLKEIVNCPEVEIYSMLKECNMDPNEAVNRLLTQDPFHEVKSKREKKKEIKDTTDFRSRGASGTSTRGGRIGTDRYANRSNSGQFGPSDPGVARGKPAYKKDNGPIANSATSTNMTGYSVSKQQPPLSDASTDKAFPAITSDNASAAPPLSGFQSAWGGLPGQVSMADIVKMGRPHGKASNNQGTSQRHVSDQHAMASSSAPGLRGHPSQNHSVKVAEPEVTGSQHVPPNDGWHLEEEPPAASVSSVVEPSQDSETFGDYHRVEQQFTSQAEEVRYSSEYNDANVHTSFTGSVPDSDRKLQESNTGGASGFENHLYHNINSYHVDHHEDVGAPVSSVTNNFENLALQNNDDSPAEEDAPAVKIPDHLQVQSADCSHLSFGSFGAGMSGPYAGPFASRPVKSDEEEAAVAADAPVGHQDPRNTEYYEEEHLRSTSDEDTTHRLGPNSSEYDTPSVSQPDMMKQEAHEVPQGNQYSFPSSDANYSFENSQQLNTSFVHSQMQGLPSLSGVMPYSTSLPSALLASNVQQPLREAELGYSPFSVSQSMQAKYGNSVSSISGPAASMAEALKNGNFSAAQPAQSQPGGSASGGPSPQQHLPAHPYSQPQVPLGHFTNMIGYPTFVPQSYTYLPQSYQQFAAAAAAAAAGNSNYPQSLAGMFKNSVSVSSLPQSAGVAPGYGAFGSANSIPGNFPLNPPAAPAGTSMSYDDLLSSQYKDLLSLQQGVGARTMSGVPGSTYYSFQGQSQQPAAAFRQSQQPSQHFGGPLSGYPNFYPSQGGPTLEQQLQMSRDGSLGGSQGQQPKQNPQQLWQNSY